MIKSFLSFLLLLPLLFACHSKAQNETAAAATYVLVLTDTSSHQTDWLKDYQRSLANSVTVAISGYPEEGIDEVLARLPWLLQPGVDTLVIDRDFMPGSTICDSLVNWSPSTLCRTK